MPSLMDFFGILVILFIVFGASVLPRIGEAIGRRMARGRRGAAERQPDRVKER